MTHLRVVRILSISLLAFALVSSALFLSWADAQPADVPQATPRLSTATYDPGLPQSTQGASRVEILGACTSLFVDEQMCAGPQAQDSGTFHTIWAGPARLVVEWEPACTACREMTVTLRDLDLRLVEITSESPIIIDLNVLPAGKYAVDLEFVGTLYGDVTQEVTWTAMYGGG